MFGPTRLNSTHPVTWSLPTIHRGVPRVNHSGGLFLFFPIAILLQPMYSGRNSGVKGKKYMEEVEDLYIGLDALRVDFAKIADELKAGKWKSIIVLRYNKPVGVVV